ncbi:MAG TPA: hypothetical protein VGE74_08080 [Gemmata sp.]
MPRSPSRDLSDRFTGRRGYFRSPDAFRRGRRALTVVALLAAGAWAAVDVAKPAQRVQYSHSHGRLAEVHAAFEYNCEACHKAHRVSLNPLDAFKARDRWHDLTCEKCHAGPPHHVAVNDKALAFHNRCSNCHHDHEGRSGSLVRLADKDCNWCHADLGKYYVPEQSVTKTHGEPPFANAVTNFVKDHPEFRSLDISKSPRTLTFSHAVHMSPGQAYGPNGKEAMTVARLNAIGGPAAVARYAPGLTVEKDANTKIELNCASCHALDAGTGTKAFDAVKGTLAKGDPVRALLPPRAEGAYFLPTTFEAHCRSCHPLAANEGVVERNGLKFLLPRFDVPHRLQPADLRPVLKAGYIKGLLAAGRPLDAPKDTGSAPIGKLDPQQPPPPPRSPLGDEADRLADTANRLLLTPRAQLEAGQSACYKCHVREPGTEGEKARIAKVPDRTVWLKHAKFNHASHRGATCATCHPGTGPAYFDDPNRANEPEPVQIVGMKHCRACHAPTGTVVELEGAGKLVGGGARFGCTDCHRYHNGDLPLQGRGAAARAAGTPLSLREWLTGNIKDN